METDKKFRPENLKPTTLYSPEQRQDMTEFMRLIEAACYEAEMFCKARILADQVITLPYDWELQ